MTTTGGASTLSCRSSNCRPRSSLMPIVPKYSWLTTLVTTSGLWSGPASGRPSTLTPRLPPVIVKGSQSVTAAERTPGNALIRSMSSAKKAARCACSGYFCSGSTTLIVRRLSERYPGSELRSRRKLLISSPAPTRRWQMQKSTNVNDNYRPLKFW